MAESGAILGQMGRGGTQSLTHLPAPNSTSTEDFQKRAVSFEGSRPVIPGGPTDGPRQRRRVRYDDYDAPLGGYNSDDSDATTASARHRRRKHRLRRHQIRKRLHNKRKASRFVPGSVIVLWIRFMNSDAKNRTLPKMNV